eukprot:6211931-Pleurochrysis_carterae.AAC.1
MTLDADLKLASCVRYGESLSSSRRTAKIPPQPSLAGRAVAAARRGGSAAHALHRWIPRGCRSPA